MCGIAGIVRFDGTTPDPHAVAAMTDALMHRGPDGSGTWTNANVALGHRRLKIIDLSEAASQPMLSPDGRFALVFNGEIYNFRELRVTLEAQGHRFRSSGDTEVLLKLYEIHGEGCLEFLRGMFAFAVVDCAKKTLFLARDRVGKKPVKYFHEDGVFAFASEEKALRTLPQCPRETDWEALHHFLTVTYLPAPLTGTRGIHKLPAAHCMTIHLESGRTEMRRYWSLRYAPDERKSEEQWSQEILSTLKKSVELRMIADVPVGAFLSGGVDSATIVALMSRLHPQPIKTFSIGSKNAMSELPDALRIASAFGTDHHPIVLEPDIMRTLPALVSTYEEPFGDPSVLPTYLLAKHTRRDVTVALSGDGGDECFGGYVRYPILRFSERWNRAVPALARSAVRGGARLFHRLRNDTFSYRNAVFHDSLTQPWPERVLSYMGGFTEEEKRRIETPLSARFPRSDEWFASRTHDARSRADDLIHQAMNADLETYLPDDLLPKVDLGSMAWSLEVRSPLLDQELLELTATMPARYHVRGWATKWLFKRLLRGILPEETLRKRKQGFRLPLDPWFRGELSPYVRERILGAPRSFWTLFDRKNTAAFLRDYFDSRVDRSPQVWMLLWLVEWLEQRERSVQNTDL